MENQERWSVELWDIFGGGVDFFENRNDALVEYYRLKEIVKSNYPEFDCIEEVHETEIAFKCEAEDMLLLLGDMSLAY